MPGARGSSNHELTGRMNFLAHGIRFLDEPFALAGTALPDWLRVIDRSLRIRETRAAEASSWEEPAGAVARGVRAHHRDDRWFHASSAFRELSGRATLALRSRGGGAAGFRPSIVGHLMVEMLLDAQLVSDDPSRLERYYDALGSLDVAALERAAVAMLGSEAPGLAALVRRFLEARFLADYRHDAILMQRLGRVLRHVGLPALDPRLVEVASLARVWVREVGAEHLAGFKELEVAARGLCCAAHATGG